MNEPLLEVQDLKTFFFLRRGVAQAVNGVSFSLNRGQVLGLVGESGCGKSVTAMSILRLIPSPPGRIVGGRILFHDRRSGQAERVVDFTELSQGEMRRYRGNQMAVILQDPMTSLNPVYTVGNQVAEPFRLHRRLRGAAVLREVIDVLKRVRIPNPEIRIAEYPHQFSGGMRQRVSLAMGISCSPELLIADEPTTALDVTIQAQILGLLEQLKEATGMAIILITHNLGIVARLCHRVAVMYAGRIVEEGRVERIFREPAHPYTRALMASVPRLGMKSRKLFAIEGQPPSMLALPAGCSFWPRCSSKREACEKEFPPRAAIGSEDYVRCWQFQGRLV